MSTFNHNGTQIELRDTGKFHATKNGEELVSSSLAGIKKKIDGKAAFVEFKALANRWGHVEPVVVVGIKRARRGSEWRGDEWTLQSGGSVCSIADDTPENRALLKQIEAKREQVTKAKEKLDEELKAIEAKITYRRPPRVSK